MDPTELQSQAVQKLALQIAQLSYDKSLAEARAEAAEEQVRQLKAQHTDGVVSADGQPS